MFEKLKSLRETYYEALYHYEGCTRCAWGSVFTRLKLWEVRRYLQDRAHDRYTYRSRAYDAGAKATREWYATFDEDTAYLIQVKYRNDEGVVPEERYD